MSTKLTLPPARISYPALIEPQAGPNGGAAKFGGTFLMPKTNKDAVMPLHDAIMKEGKAFFGDKFEALKNSGVLKLPLKDGDKKLDGDGNPALGYAGTLYAAARSKTRPKIVNQMKQPLAPEEVYAGCWVHAVVAVYGYNYENMSKGVGLSLLGVQFIKDDERFGTVASDDDFMDIEVPAMSADDSDLF